MFMFSASGPLSDRQRRVNQSSSSSAKSDYVPSTYIAKQLQLEEEARRNRGQAQAQQGQQHLTAAPTTQSLSESGPQHWPGPEQVLGRGYASGALGYETSLPTVTPYTSRLSTSTSHNSASDVGLGLQESTQGQASSTSTGLYPNLYEPVDTNALTSSEQHDITRPSFSGPKSIMRSESRLNKDDISKKNTSVRFSSATADLGSPRPPQSPSIYSQSPSSPFFNSTSSNGVNSTSNSNSSGLKEQGKINVLTRAGPHALNSSLGPPLGSVSGTNQPAQTYSSPKMQGDSSPFSMKSSYGYAGTGQAQSTYFMDVDGNSNKRPNGKVNGSLGKGGSLEDDEEDKDKERYMPAFLLSNTPGPKASKIEPFMDGANRTSGWDSDLFQQTGPRRDGPSYLPPHLLGEDAPPAEALYDITHKNTASNSDLLDSFARSNVQYKLPHQQQQQQHQLSDQRHHLHLSQSLSQPQQQRQQQAGSIFGNKHRFSMEHDPAEPNPSDAALFTSASGILSDTTLDRSSEPIHFQKRQRLVSGLYTSTSSTPASFGSTGRSTGTWGEFGTGKDRSSRLIDDPSLVDEWGTPLQRPHASMNGSVAVAAHARPTPSAAASAPESMLASALNSAKKRLFWG
ncbi:hypothetical protein BGZ70_001623 [Mortierella alpina]|uniref:Uncharacterized protein n=1 Tax=Mortierella alpina TaxID=64518 RepID=A0A9P6JBP8_MORAP|nr:hypothetical protein BGZ70_001623 [Mortierella alpina]